MAILAVSPPYEYWMRCIASILADYGPNLKGEMVLPGQVPLMKNSSCISYALI